MPDFKLISMRDIIKNLIDVAKSLGATKIGYEWRYYSEGGYGDYYFKVDNGSKPSFPTVLRMEDDMYVQFRTPLKYIKEFQSIFDENEEGYVRVKDISKEELTKSIADRLALERKAWNNVLNTYNEDTVEQFLKDVYSLDKRDFNEHTIFNLLRKYFNEQNKKHNNKPLEKMSVTEALKYLKKNK